MISMKKLMVLGILLFAFIGIAHAQNSTVEVWLFYGHGCPHCAEMKPFLESLAEKYPIKLVEYEVYFNQTNRELFQNVSAAYGTKVQGVPTVFVGKYVFIGQSQWVDKEIENKIKECLSSSCNPPKYFLSNPINGTIIGGKSSKPTKEGNEIVSGLTWSTLIGAATVDSVNPCTLAIQLILLTTILVVGKRYKVLFAGVAFALSIYISYFLMGFGIYSALELSGLSHLFYFIVILIALAVGILSVRDFFEYKPSGWAIEIPMKWRPLLKKLIGGVVSIPGAALIGFA